VADISATQSAKFLDLVWSALMGFLLFADMPSQSTIIGGVVIASATLWLARRESSRPGGHFRRHHEGRHQRDRVAVPQHVLEHAREVALHRQRAAARRLGARASRAGRPAAAPPAPRSGWGRRSDS
jgi:hypothetical protein